MNDSELMRIAINEAKKGKGNVSPNPIVGCIIAKDGKIIAKGYHREFGGKHAETNAITNSKTETSGAKMYVTLEPCDHFGKQGPCTDAIIKAGIKEIFIATKDPNPVSGDGIKKLKENGIIINYGLLKKEATKMNEFYLKSKEQKMPFITIKMAISTDGKISYGNGKKKKITGKQAFEFTQKLRKENDAIIVGVNTIKKDNPRLNVRNNTRKNPIRIVFDSRASTPVKSKIFSQKGRTIIVCTEDAPLKKVNTLAKKAEVLFAKKEGKRIDIKDALSRIYLIGVNSVLIEPGNRLATTLLSKMLFNRLCLIISNKRIGKGLPAFNLKRKIIVKIISTKKLGKDFFIYAEKVD
ncbi:MAG: riboflavin biosynthesis protein RibD [Candidatus Diapherotrites archaeon CG11_big_fil_rev_8_21_14_0_20_37_9]|nr:MAG: riboflavin biosynthesis protein RibD [Candidatus Diapherotrites archaeon CG11_big_fil_rev_8_21_14_0_20_37_9]